MCHVHVGPTRQARHSEHYERCVAVWPVRGQMCLGRSQAQFELRGPSAVRDEQAHRGSARTGEKSGRVVIIHKPNYKREPNEAGSRGGARESRHRESAGALRQAPRGPRFRPVCSVSGRATVHHHFRASPCIQ